MEVLPISQLVFMDDATLISSSKEGLENLLTISEEFNSLVNISANHSKYELVSTQTLKNEVVVFSTQQSFISSKTITLKALGRSTSFRFLGVWFNLNLSQKFVVDQLRTECQFFATTIKHKLLTDKQLLYLYNRVLIPKLEFRAQTTSVPLRQCDQIEAPIKRLFKNKSGLMSTTPDVALYLPGSYNFTKLYSLLQKSHISNLAKNLNSSSQIGSILRLRLRQLQQMLWIPYNPTSLRDWSPWMKLMSFKKDFLANTLHSASLINIFFSPEHSCSEYTIANGSLPLLDILDKLDYIKYTPHMKKKHVMFLS